MRNHHNIRKNSDHIIINSFDYKRFYLFLLSILWRASISKSVHYSTVNGVPELDDLMRHCIKNKQVRINKLSHLKVDNFIRICVFRLIDTTNNIPDHVIKSILSNFAFIKVMRLTVYYGISLWRDLLYSMLSLLLKIIMMSLE